MSQRTAQLRLVEADPDGRPRHVEPRAACPPWCRSGPVNEHGPMHLGKVVTLFSGHTRTEVYVAVKQDRPTDSWALAGTAVVPVRPGAPVVTLHLFPGDDVEDDASLWVDMAPEVAAVTGRAMLALDAESELGRVLLAAAALAEPQMVGGAA